MDFAVETGRAGKLSWKVGGPQTNLARLDRQPPQRAKPSSVAYVWVSIGPPSTHVTVNLASLADHPPPSLDTRSLARKAHV